MYFVAAASYAAAMNPAWYLPIALGVLVAICFVLGFMGADSRPGFDGRPSSYKERWFIHSRRD